MLRTTTQSVLRLWNSLTFRVGSSSSDQPRFANEPISVLWITACRLLTSQDWEGRLAALLMSYARWR